MKKFILFPAFILTTLGGFAQLSVQPVPGGSDSFVYVKGEILYVQNDITLTQNNTTQEEASIYLRDGGQLIQGGNSLNEVSTNEGNGFLSVQREVIGTNAFAYNDWASPVGNPAALTTAGNNSNFGIHSVYEPMDGNLGIKARMSSTTTTRDGWQNPLTISTRWLYITNEPGTEAELDYHRINENNNVRAGFGFLMKGVGTGLNDVNYEFRGRPNSGDLKVKVGDGKMTLAGNPYPSALDLNQVFYDPDNLNKLQAIHFYDEDRTAESHSYRHKPYGYGVWVPLSEDIGPDYSTNTPAGAYTAAPFYYYNSAGEPGTYGGQGTSVNGKRYSPIGQGFRLIGNMDNVNVIIKNKHRIFVKEGIDNGSVFQRPMSGESPISLANVKKSLPITTSAEDDVISQLRLFAVFNDAITRDMLLLFSNHASDGFDLGFDGLSSEGLSSDAYFPIEIDGIRKPFVINGTDYNSEKRIPISFKMDAPGRIKLIVAEEINKQYNQLYLYDHDANIYYELKSDKKDGIAFALPAGDHNERFYITFQKQNVETAPWPKDAFEDFRSTVALFQNNPVQRLEVSNPEGYNIKSITVYDMNGKLVISEKNLGDDSTYSFYTGNLSDGVYMVKLLTVDDMPIDYKAIITNK